jgi:hypothetical protein
VVHKRQVAWILILLLNEARSLGESGGPSAGKGGESDVESRHFQVVAPACDG